ncbi:uncharacterized protein LOC144633789 [Oculina patagonica]
MHIWSLSLCLALSYYACVVRSQRCDNDQQCDPGKVCCSGICASRSICGRPCVRDTDCSYWEECNSGSCQTPTSAPIHTFPDWIVPTIYIPTFKRLTYAPLTYAPPDYSDCIWDSDCYGSSICEDGQCVDNDRNEGSFSWSGSKVIGIVFFVAVATVISCLYHMCKRSRKPPVLATQNAPPTGVAREATNTTHATEHELQQGNSVSNGATVIAVAELNEVSPPLPPGAPPPYSSLENAEPELPPPSYDEAVRNNSTMALV